MTKPCCCWSCWAAGGGTGPCIPGEHPCVPSDPLQTPTGQGWGAQGAGGLGLLWVRQGNQGLCWAPGVAGSIPGTFPALPAADLFDILLPMLNIYQEFVRNHQYSLQILAHCKQNRDFDKLLKHYEAKPDCEERTLETFLTYPMFQVTTGARSGPWAAEGDGTGNANPVPELAQCWGGKAWLEVAWGWSLVVPHSSGSGLERPCRRGPGAAAPPVTPEPWDGHREQQSPGPAFSTSSFVGLRQL